MKSSKFLKTHNKVLGIKPKTATFDGGMEDLYNVFRHGDTLPSTIGVSTFDANGIVDLGVTYGFDTDTITGGAHSPYMDVLLSEIKNRVRNALIGDYGRPLSGDLINEISEKVNEIVRRSLS